MDVGVTNSAKVTLAANKSLAGAAGSGALEFGSMTGDAALPTGALSWAGASGKAMSLVATSAAITITAAAASSWEVTIVISNIGQDSIQDSCDISPAFGIICFTDTFRRIDSHISRRGQDGDDGHNDDQLDQRETFFRWVNHRYIYIIIHRGY
jgi:hypothetical protein